MERLEISQIPERPSIEASIHLARYALVGNLVKGRTVLDISCGEGYGSYLLKHLGAERVVGVDIDQQSIDAARVKFACAGLEYVVSEATAIGDLFAEGTFDMIVSIETIEHLPSPTRFLESIKAVATSNAIIAITCPNDHWYFPEEDRSNPYHLRKYRFKEFQEITTSILGNRVHWSLGSAAFGFTSTPISLRDDYECIPDSWIKFRQVDAAFLASGDDELAVTSPNSAYFIGVWNAAENPIGAAIQAINMDSYASMVRASEGELDTLTQELTAIRARMESIAPEQQKLSAVEKQARDLGLRLRALSLENELVKERVHLLRVERDQLRTERDQLRIGHERYLRLCSFVPSRLRSVLAHIIRAAKRRFR